MFDMYRVAKKKKGLESFPPQLFCRLFMEDEAHPYRTTSLRRLRDRIIALDTSAFTGHGT